MDGSLHIHSHANGSVKTQGLEQSSGCVSYSPIERMPAEIVTKLLDPLSVPDLLEARQVNCCFLHVSQQLIWVKIAPRLVRVQLAQHPALRQLAQISGTIGRRLEGNWAQQSLRKLGGRRTMPFGTSETIQQAHAVLHAEKKLDALARPRSSNQHSSILHHAYRNATSIDQLRIVLEAGVNPNALSKAGETVLTQILLAADDRAYHGQNPAHRYTAKEVKAIGLLGLYGADPAYLTPKGISALHTAVHLGDIEFVCLVLDAAPNTDINVQDKYGQTPLAIACKRGWINVIKELLRRGADPNAVNYANGTLLSWALQQFPQDLELARLIIENGVTLKPDGALDFRPIRIALANGRLDQVTLLLQHEVRLGKKEASRPYRNGGDLPMVIAAGAGNYALLDLLIQRGASINATNAQGSTALHQAVRRGNRRMVQQLLHAGARADITDGNGETALDTARLAASTTRSADRRRLFRALDSFLVHSNKQK